MTDPTIQKAGTTFLTSGTDTLTLYNGQSESLDKDAGLVKMPMPGTDSLQYFVLDILGTTKTIKISGRITFSDLADTWKFIEDLETLIDGDQSGMTLTDRIHNDGQASTRSPLKTHNVYVERVHAVNVAGEPGTVAFDVDFLEAST
jgi:hypothetical protein